MGAGLESAPQLLADSGVPNRYRLVRRIARGGMGTVWCADDVVLSRRVAVKLLADQFASDEHAVRRFKREARTAARLSGHPNIVTIYDVGQARPDSVHAPGRPFIVMELLPAGSVADALRVREVRPDDPLRWLREAAEALDFAHQQGVVHRDIKPANLLLDRSRSLHVADFGIARVITDDPITRTGQAFGTAAYLSPEQAKGEPATEASDRYALAVVAFELLTGERPFNASHPAAQARQHIEAEPPRASARKPTLPVAVDGVLARGMAKRPQDRWPSTREFAGALAGALRVDPPAEAPTVIAPSRRTPTRSTRVVAAPVSSPPALPRRSTVPPRPDARPPFSLLEPPPRRRRWLALAALAAVVVGVAAAILATQSAKHTGAAAHHSGRTTSAAAAPALRSSAHHTATSTAASRPAGTTSAGGAASAETPGATSTAAAPPASSGTTIGSSLGTGGAQSAATSPTGSSSGTGPSSSPDALEARGHALMLSGNYNDAVGVLRQAVAAAPHGSLTYAYALYDLGRSLRLSGNPQAAIPILQQRLQIPDQPDVVRQELQLALTQTGVPAGQAKKAARGG